MHRRWWWIVAILALLGAPVAWYLGSPLFISRTIVEEFPLSAGAAVPPDMTRREVEAKMAEAAATDAMAEEAMPAAPIRALARGAFVDADNFHKASGTALLADIGGRRILRLEEFRVTNGPDLYVYLTEHPRPRSRQDVHEGFVSLGRLKGNVGAQNYPLPAGTNVGRYRAAIIYCQAFHVLFATATFETSP